jgi:hypothetical protein
MDRKGERFVCLRRSSNTICRFFMVFLMSNRIAGWRGSMFLSARLIWRRGLNSYDSSCRTVHKEPTDFLEIAEKTEFYTSAELEHIVNEAAKRALQDRVPISKEDLLLAIKENPPRLNKDKLESTKKPIGFV